MSNQQNATASAVSNQLISFWDTAKPQFSNVIFYNHRYILPMNVFKSMGLAREIAGETAYHVEAGWIHPNFHSGQTVSAAQGANLTFQVSTNDVVDDTIYARETDTVLFNNGTSGSIITKTQVGTNNWTVTVSPYDATFTLAVTTGDPVWIIGNSQAEGTGSPEARTTGQEVVQYPLQIVKEKYKATGSALTTELWQKTDQFGNMRDTLNSGYLDSEFRFVEQLGNIAVFGPLNTNPNNSDVNMYSIDYVVDTQGNDTPYVGGIYGINELKESIRYANKKATGYKFMFMMAPEMQLSATTGLSDVFAQNPNLFGTVGDSEYSSLFMAGYEKEAQSLGVKIEFTKIRYSSYNFHLVPIGQWGTEVAGGAQGFGQTGYGYQIPLTKSEDAEGVLRDRFCMTYKRKDRWNRAMQVWETGAQAMIPTDDIDVLNVNYLGHWGTEFFGAEHFQKVSPAVA